MRKAKIVCTLGPASMRPGVLKKMIDSGMNVARLNFSHGTHESHKEIIDTLRETAAQLGKSVAILQDLCGPKIRLGEISQGPLLLEEGQTFTLYEKQMDGTKQGATVSYPGLWREITEGKRALIDDGLIELLVQRVEEGEVHCRVIVGGMVSSHKGVNFPGTVLSVPSLTEKDIADLRFGIENEVDFVAVSFVRRADDLLPAFQVMREMEHFIPLIPKIEKPEALEDIEEILSRSYGLMIARGDLGVECPFEEVPIIQKRLIKLCNERSKPVITATQMLDSMIRNPSPTRAEATDIANAIFDGTDAIMLSGESASGKYPVEAVMAMSRIAEFAEQSLPYDDVIKYDTLDRQNAVETISYATCEMANQMKADAIVVFTSSGRTAHSICRFRPKAHIVALTDSPVTVKRLLLSRGVFPVLIEGSDNLQEMLVAAGKAAMDEDLVKPGDLTVVTAGAPDCMKSSTNMIMLYVVSEFVLRGIGMGAPRTAMGRVVLIRDQEDLRKKDQGNIIVVNRLDLLVGADMTDVIGIVVVSDESHSKAGEVLAKSNIPAVIGVPSALETIPEGVLVRVDALRGLVSVQGKGTEK